MYVLKCRLRRQGISYVMAKQVILVGMVDVLTIHSQGQKCSRIPSFLQAQLCFSLAWWLLCSAQFSFWLFPPTPSFCLHLFIFLLLLFYRQFLLLFPHFPPFSDGCPFCSFFSVSRQFSFLLHYICLMFSLYSGVSSSCMSFHYSPIFYWQLHTPVF